MHAYLDHAATEPMRPEALSAMLPFLTEHFGNPSGAHSVARSARRAVDDAREEISRDLGCEPGEVVFTANGTEADNLAVLGAAGPAVPDPGAVVCSSVEHHAVLRPVESMSGRVVAVEASGALDLDALSDSLGPRVRMVSVMLANNEVGTIQPFAEVESIVRERAPQALLHTDAVAAAAWLDVAVLARHADMLSVSAHKFGGPKGVGALVVRGDVSLSPSMFGGRQERGRRPGTHDVAGIVGMASALRSCGEHRAAEARHVRALRDRLATGILTSVPGAVDSAVSSNGDAPGAGARTLPSIFHVRIDGVDSEELLLLLDEAGICASAGAACASGAVEPSHVLLAMGLTQGEARSALRMSLGPTTTDDEVDYTLEVLPKLVEQLRR